MRAKGKKPAPSTMAASMTSCGTAVMPARKITIANGKKRHALTTITHSIARCGLPSQFGASERVMMPSAISVQLMTL